VLLVHCALLADLTTDNTQRNNYNNVGSLLGVAGGAAGAVSYYLYDEKDMRPFQTFCLGAAAVSCLGFWWTGTRLDVGRLDTLKEKARNKAFERSQGLSGSTNQPAPLLLPLLSMFAPRPRRRRRRTNTQVPEQDPLLKRGKPLSLSAPDKSHAKSDEGPTTPKAAVLPAGVAATPAAAGGGRKLSFCGFMKQLSSHGNFWLYVSMNFVENFNGLFDQSFFVFLDTKLVGQAAPRTTHGVFTALCLYAPKLMTQVLTPVADRFGTYKLIMGAAAFKLIAGMLMFAAGRQAWPVWMLLFLGNRLASTAWGFYNLSFSDVIDEDTLRNKRPESMSVSVHGVQALFVKPAQSLAPILGMAFLPEGALKTDLLDMTAAQAKSVQKAAFTLMWAVPTGCGFVQVGFR
ncbi:unnamed protein product, partial [Hapterophycus canaliculatus]